MATNTITYKVDDLTGERETDGHTIETVSFALEGQHFEIDLHGGNAKGLRDALAAYVAAARKATGFTKPTATKARGSGAPAKADREQNQAIRDWARSRGALVNDRGRIAAEITDAYNLGGQAAEDALAKYIQTQRARVSAQMPNGQAQVAEQVPANV